MKIIFLIILLLFACACGNQGGSFSPLYPTPAPTITPTMTTPTATATPSPTPTATPSPTPSFSFVCHGDDPDDAYVVTYSFSNGWLDVEITGAKPGCNFVAGFADAPACADWGHDRGKGHDCPGVYFDGQNLICADKCDNDQ